MSIEKLCTLKPCPLCGREVQLTEWRAGTPYNDGQCVDYSGKIECECGLTFEHEWTLIKAADGLIVRSENIFQAWNNPAGRGGAKWLKRRNEMTCSACKFIFYSNNAYFNYCPNCGARMEGKNEHN